MNELDYYLTGDDPEDSMTWDTDAEQTDELRQAADARCAAPSDPETLIVTPLFRDEFARKLAEVQKGQRDG